MKKELTLGLLMVLFAGLSVAAPLQNFEYGGVGGDAFDGFELDVTGGETLEGNVTFENRLNRDLPLMFEISVSSDKGMVGPEFDVDASLPKPLGILDCNAIKVSKDTVDYRCFNSSDREIESGLNTIYFSSTANTRIAPGTYDVQVSVRSEIGKGRTVVESENVSANRSEEFDTGSGGVSVNASQDASVTVKALDRVSASSPSEGSDYISGVSVDVSNDSKDVKATGTVSFTYDDEALDDRDLDVYFYNDSKAVGERWEVVGGTHYPSNNSVVAEVSHFSTYAAFAEQEQQQQQEDDNTVPSFDGPVEFAPPRDEEEEVNDSEPQDESDGEDDIQQNDTQEDDEDSSGDDGTGLEQGDDESTAGPQQDSGPENPAGPTGLFTGQSGNVVLGLMALLVAVLAVLQYVGRVDIRELGSYFEGWRRS